MQKILQAGLDVAFQLPLLRMTGKATSPVIQFLHQHFSQSSYVLVGAFQKATTRALCGIAAGLEEQGLPGRIASWFASKKSREFAAFQQRYLPSFEASLNPYDKTAFSSKRRAYQQSLIAAAKQVMDCFPADAALEGTLEERMARSSSPQDVEDLLLENLAVLLGKEGLLLRFLKHQGLLLSAVLFFFRSDLLHSPAVKAAYDLGQKKGLLSSALQETTKDPFLSHIRRFGEDEQRFFAEVLEQNQEIKAYLSSIDENLERIKENLKRIEEELGKISTESRKIWEELRDLKAFLQGQGVVAHQVTIHHEFFAHTKDSLRKLDEAKESFRRLAVGDPGYSQAALEIGGICSTASRFVEAKEFFGKAWEAAGKGNDRGRQGLAAYNLFQVALREARWEEALGYLLQAIPCEPRLQPFPIDVFQPERILGSGGMGCAFLCRTSLGRKRVVVKTFWETKKGSIQEVFQEAFAMQTIDPEGTHIPKVEEIRYMDGYKQEGGYMVMEYIDGALDGEAYLAKFGKLSFHEGLRVGMQLAEALEMAHRVGIAHLDLKPANLLLIRKEGGLLAKVIDFGLARAATSLREEAIRSNLSRSGKSVLGQTILGTISYAPPEQLGRLRDVPPGAYSDIYAFGKTLYRLLTAREPSTLNSAYLPPDPGFQKLLFLCVEESPSLRPSASQVLADLEGIFERGEGQMTLPPWYEGLLRSTLDDKILEASEEVLLYTQAQGYLSDGAFAEMIRRWLLETGSRRRLAINAEEWLAEQEAVMPVSEVWRALETLHPSECFASGQPRLHWHEPSTLFRDDPAFALEGGYVALRKKKRSPPTQIDLPVFQKEGLVAISKEEGPDLLEGLGGSTDGNLDPLPLSTTFGWVSSGKLEALPLGIPLPPSFEEIAVGRLKREMALAYRLWVQFFSTSGRELQDSDTLRLEPQKHAQLLGITIEAGESTVAAIEALFTGQVGLQVVLCDKEGKRAEAQASYKSIRLEKKLYYLALGREVFFSLNAGWLNRKAMKAGEYKRLLFEGLETKARCTFQTPQGIFEGECDPGLGEFSQLQGLFAAWPELKEGDVLCFKPLAPAAMSDAEGDRPPEIPASTFWVDRFAGTASLASKLPRQKPSEGTPAPPERSTELPAIPVFQKEIEIALEHQIAVRILHPKKKTPVPPMTLLPTLKYKDPQPEEFHFHGRNRVSRVGRKLAKMTGLRLEVLTPEGQPAQDEQTYAEIRLPRKRFLGAMHNAAFVILQDVRGKSKKPSWVRRGQVHLGKVGHGIFEEEAVELFDTEGCFPARYDGTYLQGLKPFFRAHPEMRPGDTICFVRVDEEHLEAWKAEDAKNRKDGKKDEIDAIFGGEEVAHGEETALLSEGEEANPREEETPAFGEDHSLGREDLSTQELPEAEEEEALSPDGIGEDAEASALGRGEEGLKPEGSEEDREESEEAGPVGRFLVLIFAQAQGEEVQEGGDGVGGEDILTEEDLIDEKIEKALEGKLDESAAPPPPKVEGPEASKEADVAGWTQTFFQAQDKLQKGDLQGALVLFLQIYRDDLDALEQDGQAYHRVLSALSFQKGLENKDTMPELALRQFETASLLDPSFLPERIVQEIQEAKQIASAIQAKRFVMLVKEAHQIAQTSPKRSSRMFEQAKEMMPMRWTPRMQEWLEYTTLLSQKQTSEDSELSEEK